MKTVLSVLVFFATFLSVSVAHTEAAKVAFCPSGFDVVYLCQSLQDREGDSVVASNILNTMAICSHSGEHLLAIEKYGDVQFVSDEFITVEPRTDEVTYIVTADALSLSLQIQNPSVDRSSAIYAKFHVAVDLPNDEGLNATSTYICH